MTSDRPSVHRQAGPSHDEEYCQAVRTALAQLAGAADPLVPVVWSVQEWANQDMSLIQVGALQKPQAHRLAVQCVPPCIWIRDLALCT